MNQPIKAKKTVAHEHGPISGPGGSCLQYSMILMGALYRAGALRICSGVALALALVAGLPENVLADNVITPAQIEASIREGSDFPAKQQFSIQLNGTEVRVSTYLVKESKQPEQDSKIDAVLIARSVIRKFPDLVRIVTDFYPSVRRGNYRQVSVTKAEILAFASGQVSKDELLTALRSEELVDADYVNRQEKKVQDIAASVDAAKNALQRSAEKRTSPESQWSTYDAGAFTFQYPVVWTINKANNEETIVKFDGSLVTEKEASIDLKLFDDEGLRRSVIEEARIHVAHHVEFRGHQVTKRSDFVKFGVNKALSGVNEDYSYLKGGDRGKGHDHGHNGHDKEGKTGGTRVYEEGIYFGWPGRVYRLRFSAYANDYRHVRAVFERMAGSMQFKSKKS